PARAAVLELVEAGPRNADHLDRDVDVGLDGGDVSVERGGRYADHREGSPVDPYRPPDDVRIAAEAVLPEPVAHDGDRVRPHCRVLLRCEDPAARGVHAHRTEVAVGYQHADDAVPLLPDAEAERLDRVAYDVRQRLRLCAQVAHLGVA